MQHMPINKPRVKVLRRIRVIRPAAKRPVIVASELREPIIRMRASVERQERNTMRPVIVVGRGYLRGGVFFGKTNTQLLHAHEFRELFLKQHLRFNANRAVKFALIHERKYEGRDIRGVKLIFEPEQVLANLGTTKSMKRLTDATLEKYGVTFRRIVSYLRKKRGYAASINEITDYWEKQGVISKKDKTLFPRASAILQRCGLAESITAVKPSERDTDIVKIRTEIARFILSEKHGGIVLDEEISEHLKHFVKANGISGETAKSIKRPLGELRDAGIIAGETELIARGLKDDTNRAIYIGRYVLASLFYREPHPPESLHNLVEMVEKAKLTNKDVALRTQNV